MVTRGAAGRTPEPVAVYVLVTGGAGYIGSHSVAQLRGRGHGVLVLDRLDRQRQAPGDVDYIVGDVADSELVETILGSRRFDAIVHLAGDKSAEDSLRNPGRYFRNNVNGTLVLLEAVARSGVPHFIFSSSCAVYGIPDTLPITEDAAVRPTTPYGESKLFAERMLGWFRARYGLRYASLRYFNAAGAAPDGSLGEDWTAATNLIPIVLRAASTGGTVRVFGTDYETPDGTAIRDYTHVVDLAHAHLQALDYLTTHDEALVLNLGTGQGSSVLEVIETARRVTGREIAVEYTERREGDPAAVFADSGRARELLRWQPSYGLEEIVATAWRWHRSQRSGDDDQKVAMRESLRDASRAPSSEARRARVADVLPRPRR